MSDHKQWISEIFDRAAPEYGKNGCSFFNYFGKRLVEYVDIPSNAHILDVATGRGAILFPLAQAVGPLGKVVGIDISPQMIHETSVEVLENQLDWVELLCMDAEHLPFPDNTFDFIFCGFALFFFTSISSVLSEFKRVLKPGGTLAVSIWGTGSALNTWRNEELKKLCKTKDLIVTSVKTELELRKILEAAQFINLQITEETKTFVHQSPEEWWDSLWTHGTRAKFEQLSPDQLSTFRKKALQYAGNLADEQGLPEELHVFYGIAQKSS